MVNTVLTEQATQEALAQPAPSLSQVNLALLNQPVYSLAMEQSHQGTPTTTTHTEQASLVPDMLSLQALDRSAQEMQSQRVRERLNQRVPPSSDDLNHLDISVSTHMAQEL